MSGGEVFLRPDVFAEPLVDRFYACPLNIPPFTSSLYFESYLAKVEAKLADPKYSGHDKESLGLFVKAMKENNAGVLEFAKALRALDELVAKKAKGFGLDSLYAEVPAELRGFVEFGYDQSHNPVYRFFERYLYDSEHYDPERQSLYLARHPGDDARSPGQRFPRLDVRAGVLLNVSFDNPALDDLFAMRWKAGRAEPVLKKLGVSGEKLSATLSNLFTTSAPESKSALNGDGVRMRYFGHASVLMQSKQATVMADPTVGYATAADGRFSFSELPEKIDYVVITHGHADHLNVETLLQIRNRIGTIVVPRANEGTLVDPSLKLIVEKLGFKDVVEIEEGQTISIPGGSITGVGFFGEQGDLAVRGKIIPLVNLNGRKFLLAADSKCLDPELYRRVCAKTGEVDVLFMSTDPMGVPVTAPYGPVLLRPLPRDMDESRPLNSSDFKLGKQLVDIFNPKHVYVYALALEPWMHHLLGVTMEGAGPALEEAEKLIVYSRQRKAQSERLYIHKELNL